MLQGIQEQSATQKYPLGMRYAEGDRVFRYARAAADLTNKWGAGNVDTLHEQNSVGDAVAGATDIAVALAAMAKDELKDGYINIWTAVNQVCLRIAGNEATVGGNTTIHLRDPLLADVAAGTFTDVHENPYRNVGAMGTSTSVVGIPLINVTNGYYFWLQTWGPVIGVAHVGGGIGANANERNVHFHFDGSISIPSEVGGTTDAQQAGFLLGTTDGSDDIFFMLQLAP